MNLTFIDTPVSKSCVNPNSYGEICVQCGCCEKNPDYRDRVIKQTRLYKELLAESRLFDEWDEDNGLAVIQKRNMERNILYYKMQIRLLKKILRGTRRQNKSE
mgnify:CR=1 FL=1